MKWTNKLVALAAAIVMTSPSVASAYYWYGATPYIGYTPKTLTAPVTNTTASTTANAMSPVEQTLLRLTNQERAKLGLSQLQADTTLTSLARMKSNDMVAKNYFSHTSPTYGTPAQMLAQNGVKYTAFAENIAQGGDANTIHTMWMNSAGHRANILNPKLTHIGIGVATSGRGYTATQLFIAR